MIINTVVRLTKSRTVRIGLISAVFISLLYITLSRQSSYVLGVTTQAAGNLTITYNQTSPPEPLFSLYDVAPGDCQNKTVTINNSGVASQVYLLADNVSDDQNLSSVVRLSVSESNQLIFSEQLNEFFAGQSAKQLASLTTNETKEFEFEVCLLPQTGNSYQDSSLTFDLVFGHNPTPIELPQACSHLQLTITDTILGSIGNDIIRGSSKNELIIDEGGNNLIFAGGGSDCIVTAAGNDVVFAGSGADVVISSGGNNVIEAGSGIDAVYSASGNDVIRGGSGDDYLDGGTGRNIIHAGTGNDTCKNAARFFSCESIVLN